MKEVTVFVPITMIIKGDNKLKEVREQLEVINNIVGQSELESKPDLLVYNVYESEIVEN